MSNLLERLNVVSICLLASRNWGERREGKRCQDYCKP